MINIEEAFLLNIFNKSHLLYYFYNLIKNNSFKNEIEIVKLIDVPENLVKEVIRGLYFFELIEKIEDTYKRIEIPIISSQISEDINFKLYMLSILRSKIGNYLKWEKNAPNLLIIEYLIKNNIKIIERNDKIFCAELNDYFSKTSYNQIQMNTNKLANWCEIFHYLGFLTKITSSRFIFHINDEFFMSLMELYYSTLKNNVIYLKDFLDWVNKNYFLIPTKANKIPNIICKILYSLCRDKYFKFIKSGDKQLMELVDKPSLLNIPREINAIELLT